MVLRVVRRYHFEAAHALPWHPGRCRRLHGHSYVLEVEVAGPVDERGVVMDFAEVDEVVGQQVLHGPEGWTTPTSTNVCRTRRRRWSSCSSVIG